MLPQSLEAATARMMRQGSVAREVFGDEFVEHFGGTREHEIRLWNSAVTNWEGECRILAAPFFDVGPLTTIVA
jgi:glutamine synthetase